MTNIHSFPTQKYILPPANISRLKFNVNYHMHWKINTGEEFYKQSIENFVQVDGILSKSFDF